MDLEKLRAAATAGDEAALRLLIAAEVQDAVAKATADLVEKRTKAEASVQALETKQTELLDELKPIRRALEEAGVKGVDGLAEALKKPAVPEGEDFNKRLEAELRARTEQLAATQREKEAEAKKALEKAQITAEKAQAARDRAALEARVYRATNGEKRPQLASPRLEQHFLDHLAGFVRWEDTTDGRREPVARHGEVPIMSPTTGKPATVEELVEMAAASRGTGPWDKDTADYFRSNGTGGGAGEGAGGSRGTVTAEVLGKTTSLSEYAKQKERLAAN